MLASAHPPAATPGATRPGASTFLATHGSPTVATWRGTGSAERRSRYRGNRASRPARCVAGPGRRRAALPSTCGSCRRRSPSRRWSDPSSSPRRASPRHTRGALAPSRGLLSGGGGNTGFEASPFVSVTLLLRVIGPLTAPEGTAQNRGIVLGVRPWGGIHALDLVPGQLSHAFVHPLDGAARA